MSVALCAAGAVALAAQQPEDRIPFDERLNTWYTAIDSHVPGEQDAATTAVANWSRADLVGVLSELKKTRDPVELNRRLKRAAMLHVDIAALNRTGTGYTLPPAERESAWYQDGRLVSIRSGTIHWEIGRLLIDAMKPNPAGDEWVRLWYHATSAFLQGWSEHIEARPHIVRALQIFPRDAFLMMSGGALHEALGETRVQSALQLPATPPSDAPFAFTRTTPRTLQPDSRIDNATNERRTAEALFRRALELDPNLMETRIRLAHVLGLRGRHREAIAEAERAVAAPLTPRMRYYAHLVLGRSHHALGQLDQASTAYRRATELFPGAQSARLGLSQVARARGNVGDAYRSLERLSLQPNRQFREDPWREYAMTRMPDVWSLLAELRRTVPR